MNQVSKQLTQDFIEQANNTSELETFDASLELLLWSINRYGDTFKPIALNTAMKKLEVLMHSMDFDYEIRMVKK